MKLWMALQNNPLTRWYWQTWQHEETGRITLLPFWKSAGRRWYRVKFKE
jgi:hypothetical protein